MTRLPQFLVSLRDFEAHLSDQFGEATSSGKGNRFAEFACHLCPLVPEFEGFGEFAMSARASHDKGIDLTARPNAQGVHLFAQAKLRINTKDEIDTIISKFYAFESEQT